MPVTYIFVEQAIICICPLGNGYYICILKYLHNRARMIEWLTYTLNCLKDCLSYKFLIKYLTLSQYKINKRVDLISIKFLLK